MLKAARPKSIVLPVTPPVRIILDYAASAAPKLLSNLSGAASIGEYLWTVSDEGRTVECLRSAASGYVLQQQVAFDGLFTDIPGSEEGAELDLESVDIFADRLWVCGSHSRVRSKRELGANGKGSLLTRPSRHFLAAVELNSDGTLLEALGRVPSTGPGSLRQVLIDDPHLGPLLELPCKENGLDIEGLCVRPEAIMLGLRGPIIGGLAVVIAIQLATNFQIVSYQLLFLDLGGLAIRDLRQRDNVVLVVAGPMDNAPGPFQLYVWTPKLTAAVQHAELVFDWATSGAKPEGVCGLIRGGQHGLLVVFDSPENARISGTTYAADWISD
ncbi:MAG: DUF3616 domain-containing protein [Devosia sp.]